MVVGLNKLDRSYLYQLLEQMSKENTDTLTFTRQDVLLELGSRVFNEHEGEKNKSNKDIEMQDGKELQSHLTRMHDMKKESADIGEFARMSMHKPV